LGVGAGAPVRLGERCPKHFLVDPLLFGVERPGTSSVWEHEETDQHLC
jgi:hypothetical protein